MLLIILDENEYFFKQLSQMLLSYDSKCKIVSFTDDNSFTDYLYNYSTKINAVIISAEYEKRGLSFAMHINEIYRKLPVIITTQNPKETAEEIFLKSSEIYPFAFISKPCEPSLIEKIYHKLKNKGNAAKTVTFTVNGKPQTLNTDDIFYIESDKRLLIIHTAEKSYRTYSKIVSLKEKLPEFFLIPHSSFLVNIKYILSFDSISIRLVSDVKIPVSRGHRKDFIEQYRRLQGITSDII